MWTDQFYISNMFEPQWWIILMLFFLHVSNNTEKDVEFLKISQETSVNKYKLHVSSLFKGGKDMHSEYNIKNYIKVC